VTSDEGAAVIDAPGAPSVPDILVRVEHVAKAFGPTQALRDCSFELRAGEVHALAGENGSGKSTLVKILSGVHLPDSGRVEVGGTEAHLRNPKAAQEHGIVTVFQEVLVAEARSVLDNVWLGADDTWRTKVPAREKRRLAKAADSASPTSSPTSPRWRSPRWPARPRSSPAVSTSRSRR
jgi:ABC-type sugar transport system ATPase subunit